jgi:hypothetical protein
MGNNEQQKGDRDAEGMKAMGRGVGHIAHKMGTNDVYHCLGPGKFFSFVSYSFPFN